MANVTTNTPMKMRFHMQKVKAVIEDLEEKKLRIDDALSKLRPLIQKKWDGHDRRDGA